MDLNQWWYFRATGIFVLFNAVALLGVLLFHRKKWNVEVTQGRHYASLVFQICGVVYALFLGFIVWDVWERFYDVKRTIQEEAKYLVDIYQDSSVLGKEMQETLQRKSIEYLDQVIENEWPNMEKPGIFKAGDDLVNSIWNLYYDYTPTTEKQNIWYRESIAKLDKFALARLTRIFNNANSVGTLRWVLLIIGGLFLLSIPCFFKIELLFFKFFLVFFLANIIAFLLYIIFSLDHPFTGHVEIQPEPLIYALKAIQGN